MKNLQKLGKILNKQEQHNIFGGIEDECQVFWRDSAGNAIGWSEPTTYEIASNSMGYVDSNTGNTVTGWCCASCP